MQCKIFPLINVNTQVPSASGCPGSQGDGTAALRTMCGGGGGLLMQTHRVWFECE